MTRPKALLLDEPLGDLDRLLQLRMRVELRNLQRQLGLMFIHVTHNQEEALSMADRIVVMNDGRIQQIGDPLTIATRPENELVAALHGRQQHHPRPGHRAATATGSSSTASTTSARPWSPRTARTRSATRRCSPCAPPRSRSVEDGDRRRGRRTPPSAEIVFVEYLGDLVKLHLEVARRAHAREGARRALPGAARPRGRARSGSPGRRRMSSSSGPDARRTHRCSTRRRARGGGAARARPRRRPDSARSRGRAARAARPGHDALGAARARSGSASTSSRRSS